MAMWGRLSCMGPREARSTSWGMRQGRPLINAVGKPRVVINGTALDYLAESFMAGDPHKGGGFVILNGMEFDEHGKLQEQPRPSRDPIYFLLPRAEPFMSGTPTSDWLRSS